MTMANQDFTMTAGDTKLVTVDVVDEQSAPIAMQGATLRWVLKERDDIATALLVKTSQPGGGITIPDVLGNIFIIRLEAADTVGLAGVYYHDCEIVDGDGNKSTIYQGHVNIRENVPEE
jgi:hypothetical protein